jgi:hypothetical protein
VVKKAGLAAGMLLVLMCNNADDSQNSAPSETHFSHLATDYGGCNGLGKVPVAKAVADSSPVTVVTSGDTLRFDVTVATVCCSKFLASFDTSGDTIRLTIDDTCAQVCYCYCDCVYTFDYAFLVDARHRHGHYRAVAQKAFALSGPDSVLLDVTGEY